MPKLLRVGRRHTIALSLLVPLVLLAGAVSGATISPRANAATALALEPGPGQFFPIAPVKALDTRDGTGGVPQSPLAAGASVDFPVTGIGAVPALGVADVEVEITAINPAQSGALEDYNTDLDNPNVFTVPFIAGQNVTCSDIVQVSQSGEISVANASSGAADVAVTVVGYTMDQSAQVAGDMYSALPDTTILDTR